MSLISEALKEAQRERSERTAVPRSASAVGEAFFPYPSAKKGRGSNRAFVIGASAVVVLVLGAAIFMRLTPSRKPARPAAPAIGAAHRSAAAPPVATVAGPTPVKRDSVVAPAAVASRPIASSAPARQTTVTPPAASSRDAKRDRAAPARSETPAKAADSVRAAAVIASPPPAVAPPAEKTAAVRVIVEPNTMRPGDSLFARAFAEHSRGNLDAAADLYEKAIARPPVSPEVYNDYGALLAGRGKHTAAIAMYNLGISANDRDPRLWTNLGDSYRALGRRADAMSAYFEAAKLDPSNVPVKLRLAGEYQAIGDTASARRGFEEAVRGNAKDPEAHYAYGSFLQSQRDFRGAARELQAFVDLAPGRYSQDVIDRTKTYVSTLRRQYP